jgi:hypothetical protein
MAIRVLIADDHAVVRQGLRAFLEGDRGLELVGEARDGAEAELVNLSETLVGRDYWAGTGRLIHAGEGRAGGAGGLRTKRSGCAA